MMYRFLLCIIAAASSSSGAAIEPRAGCEINPLLYANSPLVIPTGSDQFIYPEYGDTTLKFAVGETVDFICPGRNLVVLGSQAQEVVQGICISNLRFRILGERTLFSQISCAGDAVASSRLTGEELRERRDVCFDPVAQSPLYTFYNLTASIGNNAKGTPRPSFSEDSGFYNLGTLTVNSRYTRANQRATVNTLIGLEFTSIKYIDNGNWYFLARGHLTARSDFFYPAQQNGTFRYINAAPQWQSFNGLNWNEAELSTRAYADANGLDLQVWTGVYGVTTLQHEATGRDVGLYIYVDSNGNTALPAPDIYWKVVYDPISRRGVALIGLNNPYQTDVAKSVICPDVSNSLTWVSWKKESINDGYSYACTVPELRRVVSYAPDLDVSGGLLL
ncbi:hypothetical protein NQ318_021499 [Aromia moschata]|uniref:DNA/RNA non-specific endonuclease/pyrophosphatase/phosphodiesterase domain-containing protein n=1 Tax=Aromia moschata TaxID=1265417 RepID=A0AAV8ZCR4_9CUCU|nr:hypothetical protein NQ318_021499 [Aromia moschata]